MVEILRYLLVALEAVLCLLLIGLVLLQKTKGEGLGMAFGSGAGESLFGSRAGNVLTKGTAILAGAFLICTLFLGIIFSGNSQSQSLMSGVANEAPVQAMPQQGSPLQQPAAVPAGTLDGPVDAPVEAPVAE